MKAAWEYLVKGDTDFGTAYTRALLYALKREAGDEWEHEGPVEAAAEFASSNNFRDMAIKEIADAVHPKRRDTYATPKHSVIPDRQYLPEYRGRLVHHIQLKS